MAPNYLTAFAGFLIVLGLMGITLFLMKKLLSRMNHSFSPSSRINILETRYLDPKRKIVLIKCDNKQHLLLIGGNNDMVIDKDIPLTIEDNKKSSFETVVRNVKNDTPA